jgi:Tfp pilus assembly protein PilP
MLRPEARVSNRRLAGQAGMDRLAVAVAVAVAVMATVALSGCGDDEDVPPPPRPGAPARPAGVSATGNKNLLAERLRIEDRVNCSIPDRPTDPTGKCDPKAPSCPERTYCMQLASGAYCEPCPERDAIRHVFKERDFAAEQNRDPFQSFLLPGLSIGKGADSVPIDPTTKCPREDQLVATSYSYADLKLVGIVAQGTQRKVLMMGGPLGYIIKRGDCVGKEKAIVKDIGTGFITFLIEPDGTTLQRAPEEHSVQLNPKQLALNEPGAYPAPAPKTAITPVVPAPAALPLRGPGSGSAAGSGATPGSAAGAQPTVEPPAKKRP